MKAEDLILLAAAKGTDLKRVAGGSAPDSGPSVRKRRRPQKELDAANGRPLYESVKGSQTHVVRHPEWSHAELGQAAGQLDPLAWLAVQYNIAGDDSPSTYWTLYRGLREKAIELEVEEKWPHTVIGCDGLPRLYLESMAQLVLDEDRNAHFFTAEPRLYGWYMHVEEPVWKFKVFERFDLVRCYYQSLIGRGRALIQRRLSEPVEALVETG